METTATYRIPYYVFDRCAGVIPSDNVLDILLITRSDIRRHGHLRLEIQIGKKLHYIGSVAKDADWDAMACVVKTFCVAYELGHALGSSRKDKVQAHYMHINTIDLLKKKSN